MIVKKGPGAREADAKVDRYSAGEGSFRLDQVLLVSGLSGSGKSTFLRQLASGCLPERINAELPDGCQGWTQLTAIELERLLNSKTGNDTRLLLPGNLVLHYDLMRLVWAQPGGEWREPALSSLLQANRATVVTLRVSADRLRCQYFSRRLAHDRKLHRRIWRVLSERSRSAIARLETRRRISDWFSARQAERYQVTMLFYDDSDWVERQYERWDGLMRDAVAAGAHLQMIEVEPDLTAVGGGAPRWRLRSS